jgi:hypothetical protein
MMSLQLKAVFRNGVFVLQEPCHLPQEAEVNLIVQGPLVVPPAVTDPEERARILAAMTQRMRQNPLPAGAPRFTREQLHERR